MNEEELKQLQFENQRLKEDLRISNKNWKFENERLQLSINARLEEVRTLAKKLQIAEARVNELTVLLNIATKQNEVERHDLSCPAEMGCTNACVGQCYCDYTCNCWLSKVKKELCK